MKELIDEIRTLKMSLESRVKGRLPNDHPAMAWLVEHAAYVLNRCQLGTDGRTAYGRLHGKESTARLCEFGERILCTCRRSTAPNLMLDGDMGFSLAVPPTVIKTT